MAAQPSKGAGAGTPPEDLRGTWNDWGINAYVVAGVVVLLTWIGAQILINAVSPDVDAGGAAWGALFLGLASGVAVLGVLLTLRSGLLRRPPPEPRPPGKLEV
jgi:hypothetical protein